jgi:hypothetical protein
MPMPMSDTETRDILAIVHDLLRSAEENSAEAGHVQLADDLATGQELIRILQERFGEKASL